MARVEKHLEVAAPVARAFQYVADYRHALEWMAGFTEFAPIGNSSYGLGAKVRASGRFLGVKLTAVLEIVEFVENDHFVSTSSGLVRSTSTWSFEPTSRGTLITFAGDYHLNGLPVPLLGEGLLRHEVAATTTQSLRNLKRVLEQHPDRRGDLESTSERC